MTQSSPSKHAEIENSSLIDIARKHFRNLSTAEIEQLMRQGVEQAKKQMHDKGISTVASINGKLYEQHPDGTRTLRHG